MIIKYKRYGSVKKGTEQGGEKRDSHFRIFNDDRSRQNQKYGEKERELFATGSMRNARHITSNKAGLMNIHTKEW